MTLPTTNPWIAGPAPDVSDVDIPGDGFTIKAHMARPKRVTSAPAVVVIHARNGLLPAFRDAADGLASSGYIAVAPDLLSREGGTDAVDDIGAVLASSPPERFSGDAVAVVRWLKAQPEVTRVGIIGFCFGGTVTWRAATESPDLAAAVPCYGSNPPLEEVRNIKAAVYGIYGALDARINAGIPDITKALHDAGVTHALKTYEGVGHNFLNHTSENSYVPEVSGAAWADALAWFDKYLRG